MEQQKSETPELLSDEWFKQVSELLDSIDVPEQSSQSQNGNSSGYIRKLIIFLLIFYYFVRIIMKIEL